MSTRDLILLLVVLALLGYFLPVAPWGAGRSWGPFGIVAAVVFGLLLLRLLRVAF